MAILGKRRTKHGRSIQRRETKGAFAQEPSKDKHLVNTLVGHGDEVAAVAFNHDGSYIASGSGDSALNLWRTRSSTID